MVKKSPFVGFKVTTTEAKMIASIYSIFTDLIRQAKPIIITRVENRLRKILENALLTNETLESVVSGILRSHFGIANPAQTKNEIVNLLLNEITVSFGGIKRNVATGPSADLKFGMVWKNFAGLLGLDVSTTKSPGGDLPWMKHLLFDGDKVLIKGYKILIKEGLPKSRSGNALMIEVDNKSQRGFWRVPIEYSGVKELNFLTKLLDAIIPDLEVAVQEEVLEAFSELN